jgi:hypothetical protein
MYDADSPQIFAATLAKNAQQGDFIYLSVDGTTDFAAIRQSFDDRQLELAAVADVLSD